MWHPVLFMNHLLNLQNIKTSYSSFNKTFFKNISILCISIQKNKYLEYRYSDIIVHRLLAVCVGADASYPDLLEKKKTQSLCNNLNYRHKMAQYAGRASVNLHTHLFFKSRVQDEDGYVLFVRKNALQILIPKYGLESTLYLNDNKKSEVKFVYNEEKDTQTAGDTVFHVFDHVIIQLRIDRSNVQHLKLSIQIVKPEIPGFSVPPASDVKDEGVPPSKKAKH